MNPTASSAIQRQASVGTRSSTRSSRDDNFIECLREAQSLTDRESRGRLALFGVDKNGKPIELESTYVFTADSTVSTLQAHWEQFDDRYVHILWILEDLPAAGVQYLHESLDIPISVFALHSVNPEDYVDGTKRIPMGTRISNHFILNYLQFLPYKMVNDDKESSYRVACDGVRYVTSKARPYEGNEACEQLFTFWSNTRSLNRPQVVHSVFLVDPCPQDQNEAIYHVHKDDISRSDDYMYCETGAASIEPDNLTTPLFDDLYDVLIQSKAWPVNDSPLVASFPCRRLILARTSAVIRLAHAETLNITARAALGVNDISNFNFNTFEQKAWSMEWQGKWFKHLWELREDLELLRFKLEQNIKVVERIYKYLSDKNQSRRTTIEELILTDEDEDLLEWQKVRDLQDYSFKIMDRTTDSYLQTVEATTSQLANIQTRNVNRLTGLASLFVPASLCAAVLAIPSLTADTGSRRFWIFWVISVPLAIILALLFLSPVPQWIRDFWNTTEYAKPVHDLWSKKSNFVTERIERRAVVKARRDEIKEGRRSARGKTTETRVTRILSGRILSGPASILSRRSTDNPPRSSSRASLKLPPVLRAANDPETSKPRTGENSAPFIPKVANRPVSPSRTEILRYRPSLSNEDDVIQKQPTRSLSDWPQSSWSNEPKSSLNIEGQHKNKVSSYDQDEAEAVVKFRGGGGLPGVGSFMAHPPSGHENEKETQPRVQLPAHKAFCEELGIGSHGTHGRLYGIIAKSASRYEFRYWLMSITINVLSFSQIALGATAVALSAARKSWIALTAVTAIVTYIAALLLYFQSQNQPARARQAHNEFKALLVFIEDIKLQVTLNQIGLREAFDEVIRRHELASQTVERNHPDIWWRQSPAASAPVTRRTDVEKGEDIPRPGLDSKVLGKLPDH